MFWNVASARGEISLRKWSGGSEYLRTFRGAFVAEMRFVGSNASFSLMLLYTWYRPGLGKLVQWKSHLQKTKKTESRKTSL